MKISLIISRFKESKDEIQELVENFKPLNPKVYLYNKSEDDIEINYDNIIIEKIDNLGRESHTYFYHMIKYYDSLEDIRNRRISSRANATKLLSDDEIRKININRYLEKLGSFQDEKGNLVNLQKFILYTIYGQYAFYSIFNYQCLHYIERFMDSIDSLIKFDNKDRVKSTFKQVYKNNDNKKNITKGLNVAKTRIKNDKVQYVISVIEQIDRIIYDYIKGLNLDNINDLEFIYHKLSTISSIIHSDRFRLYSFRNLLARLSEPDMIVRNYIRKGYWHDEDLDKDIVKIDNIKRYIESLCK